MKPNVTLLDAMADHNLFGPWFRDPNTWAAWRAWLTALFALPMTPDQLTLYRAATGRTEEPKSPAEEAWLVCGRRAGKSFMLALVSVYLGCFRDYREYLTPGERATVMVIATDRKQARVIFRYVRGLLTLVPMLKRMIEREAAEGFDLSNAVTIEISTASFKTVRGYTLAAVLADELAFWPTDDAASPDYAVLDAVRPGMSTIPGAMLLCASSPYARRGALWDAHRRHFAKNGDPVLVWQAATRQMNPNVPQRVIDEAMERDPASAAAEFLAQFRSDIESFVAREAVQACIALGVLERPPVTGIRYAAFTDPSGGSADAFTLAIAHKHDDDRVLDAIREVKPPFSPESVIKEFASLLKSYGINKVVGDRYAGEFPREIFRKHGVEYALSELPKSGLYQAFLPILNSKRADLLDHDRLFSQLVGLERRTSRAGRDQIDHAPGGHDDVVNAVAGVFATLGTMGGFDRSYAWIGEADDEEWRNLRMRNFVNSGGAIR